jgi:hypothetical protein
MARQGAGLDVGRLRARVGPFVVPAVVEPPVPTQLRARRVLCNASVISDQPTDPCSAMYPAATVSEIPWKLRVLISQSNSAGVSWSLMARMMPWSRRSSRISARYDADPARQHVACTICTAYARLGSICKGSSSKVLSTTVADRIRCDPDFKAPPVLRKRLVSG